MNKNKKPIFIGADAICSECGTSQKHSSSGNCKNGHNNWLSLDDEIDKFIVVKNRFGVSVSHIANCIKNNDDLPERIR